MLTYSLKKAMFHEDYSTDSTISNITLLQYAISVLGPGLPRCHRKLGTNADQANRFKKQLKRFIRTHKWVCNASYPVSKMHASGMLKPNLHEAIVVSIYKMRKLWANLLLQTFYKNQCARVLFPAAFRAHSGGHSGSICLLLLPLP